MTSACNLLCRDLILKLKRVIEYTKYDESYMIQNKIGNLCSNKIFYKIKCSISKLSSNLQVNGAPK